MTEQQINNIKKHHGLSFKGLFSIIKTRKPLKQPAFIVAVALSVFFLIVFIFNPTKSFIGVEKIANIIITCFPSLLGFSLAGYTIVVAFPNTELIQEDSDPNDYSLYQVLNAFFGLSVILQVLATAAGFCVWWLIEIDISSLLNFHNIVLGNAINIVLAFFLIFISLYTICLTPYIAINLFSLSQVNSTFFTIKKIERNESDSNNSP